MLDNLDQSVGRLIFALQQKGMLHNSIILFTTDNGGSIFSNVKYSFYSTVFIGPAAGFDLNKASNWPLRGIKNTLWEGGVRGSAFLWSPLLKNSSRVHSQGLMGIQDWLPTLYHAAGTMYTFLSRLQIFRLFTFPSWLETKSAGTMVFCP